MNRQIAALFAGPLCVATLASCAEGVATGDLGPTRDGGHSLDASDAGNDSSSETGADAGAGDGSDSGSDARTDAFDGTDAFDASADADAASDAALDTVDDAPADTSDAADLLDATDLADSIDAPADTDAAAGCPIKDPLADNADRTVLVGQPYTDDLDIDGTSVRRLTLLASGTLVDAGESLDVGFTASRIEFMPSGTLALVLGERGELASVEVGTSLRVLDTITLPRADYGDIVLSPEEGLAFIVGLNVDTSSGVSTVSVGCDGELTNITSAFLNIRLADSMTQISDDRAVLLGGQAVFAPVDVFDIRLLERDGPAWVEIDRFDIFGDFVSTGRIASSPSGDRVLIPNSSLGSSEGSQVLVLAVEGETVREVQRITGLDDPSEVHFSPDGSTAVVTLVEPGRVVVLRREPDGTFVETERIAGIGLPDQIGAVRRGALAGTMLIPSIDVSGVSNIAMLRFAAPGDVTDLGQFDLGEDIADIPSCIGLAP